MVVVSSKEQTVNNSSTGLRQRKSALSVAFETRTSSSSASNKSLNKEKNLATTAALRPWHNNKQVRIALLLVGLFFLVFWSVEFWPDTVKLQIKDAASNVWYPLENYGLMKKAPPFQYDYLEEYPDLKMLEDNYMVIREELDHLLNNMRDNIVDMNDLKGGAGFLTKTRWKTFVFQLGEFIPENCKYAPKTTALLKQIPNLYMAHFSILDAHEVIAPHWGYYKGYIRYHLGLKIPNNNANKDCVLRIRQDYPQIKENDIHLGNLEEYGVRHYWKEGEGVLFDDTFYHDARNDSNETRVVLWLDLARSLPWYLHLYNKIVLLIAMNDNSVKIIRDSAIMQID